MRKEPEKELKKEVKRPEKKRNNCKAGLLTKEENDPPPLQVQVQVHVPRCGYRCCVVCEN